MLQVTGYMLRERPKGSAMLTTIFLLLAILTISLIGLDIILGGLAARRAQGASARAFYAAEAGIERAVTTFKLDKDKSGQPLFADCAGLLAGGYLKFCDDAADNCATISANPDCEDAANPNNKHIYHLNNDSTLPAYWVRAKIIGRDIELNSRGNYLDTNRELFVKFCLPDCVNKAALASDGCGGFCKE